MHPTRQARLEAKVKAINNAHAYAVALSKLMLPAYEPLIGLDIFKADGTLLQKIDKRLPPVPESPQISVWRDTGRYSIRYVVKAVEQVDHHTCTYYEISVYIAHVSGAIIEKLYDPTDLRSDYTAEEINGKREAYKQAQQLADAAKSALWPFGEEDR
jgi:hypothetical protein